MKEISIDRHFFACIIASIFFVYGIGASNSSYAKTILVLLALVWTGLIALGDLKRLWNIFRVPSVIYYCIFLSFFLVGVLAGNNYLLGLKYFGTYVLYLMIFFMYEYYSRLENDKYLKFILKYCFWGFLFFVVIALAFYMINPGAARILAREPNYYGTIIIGGGYQLAYLTTIIVSYLMLRPTKRNILICIILAILLVKTQSTITIIIGLFGAFTSLLCILLRRVSKKSKILIWTLALLTLIFLYIFRVNIGNILIVIGGNGESSVTERINEIGSLLNGGSLGDQRMMQARAIVYKESIDIIKMNPIFGEMFSCGVIPGFGASGGHSDILDALSQWGGIFGGIYLAIFFSGIIKVKKMLKDGWGYVLAMIFLMLLNPSIGFSLCVGAFFIIPAMEQIEQNKEKGS